MSKNVSTLPRRVTLTVVAVASLLVAAAIWLFVNRAGVLGA